MFEGELDEAESPVTLRLVAMGFNEELRFRSCLSAQKLEAGVVRMALERLNALFYEPRSGVTSGC